MKKRTSFARPVYLVDGSRSPFLKAQGKPGPFSASDLAVAAARPLLLRQLANDGLIDEVILGCVMPGADEANIARVVALRCGLGEQTPAWTVQRNCASGLQAIDSAAHDIASGRAELVLVGGTEAMSHAPVLFNHRMVEWLSMWLRARSVGARLQAVGRLRPAMFSPIIGLLRGLTDPVVGLSMGQTAEVLAHRFAISREEMDAYALRSHERLAHAEDEQYLDEIVSLFADDGRLFETDEGLRREGDMSQLARLRPAFDRLDGKVTPGNSAQITDGAAMLLLASEKAIEKHALPVLARIIDSEWAGLDPAQMGLGPVHAMTPLLKRHKLSLDEIDYWEINEAFAAQVLACLAAWRDAKYCREHLHSRTAMGEIDTQKLNIDGGGISLGHPVGASGARIVLHLAKTLKRTGAQRGMASLCIGGGQGGAMLIERVPGEAA
ncbi:acetyl-CoA C-acetyltransferase [Sulfuriflexus mobilis]|uniref:acetyl-CoA C-acetyltransferase n=1 Tax=Sulfuriflexus mobilis TaxID=1811807 RepID=UPI000F82302C|nr:acetyl-CoA C-acetyltransferase [Sulfuriflexus mobilis]